MILFLIEGPMKRLRNILPHSVWNKRAGVLYVPISGNWESKGLEQ